jgi:7-hydroxymethyl chlorophyll a reductase
MSRVETLEPKVHGRGRDFSNDELRLGVVDEVFYAKKNQPVEGAQWTGIVTSIAIEMLQSGKVEGVVCVASQPDDPMKPRPILATTVEQILSSKGVKPSLSPNLEILAEVEARGLKRLLFIGVGCAVTALRGVEQYLGLDALYVMGTNCTDNGRAETLPKFLNAASDDPGTVMHYEFMQDYRVHLKHEDGRFEKIPYFCLPANDLKDVIAPSCYSCFDYVNGLADLVVGYMGVPMSVGTEMNRHPQYVTVRNRKGKEMFDTIRRGCDVTPSMSYGDRKPFVVQTVVSDDEATLGRGPEKPAPAFVGNVLAAVLEKIGPRGKEFGMYSLDYHTVRNFLYVKRHFGSDQRANQHVPEYARRIVDEYNRNGAVDERLKLTNTGLVGPALPPVAKSGRTPAPGVGCDDDSESPFLGLDPSIVGGLLGFVLVSTIASKVMGGG